MKRVWICVTLALWSVSGLKADITVTFANDVFRLQDGSQDPTKLVTFGGGTGNLLGSGVRNGVLDNASYLVQLFQIVEGSEIPVGAPANFRASTTTRPGTWSGGTRTIVGVNPGEIVMLKVKAWDSSASFDTAHCLELLSGQSSEFAYSMPAVIPPPADTRMTNFTGFSIGKPLTPCRVLPRPVTQEFVTPENQGVRITAEANFCCTSWVWWSQVENGSRANRLSGLAKGDLVWGQDPVVYAPKRHEYGEELFRMEFCCSEVVLAKVTILPSSQRPYLAVSGEGFSQSRSLVLRGLAPKRYRVDQSDDLAAWTPVGEFTANYSEVPVQDLALADAKSRFYRAVELLP